jgi:molecular chaperone GrpE
MSSDQEKAPQDNSGAETDGASLDAASIGERDADFSRLDENVEIATLRASVESWKKEAEEQKDRYIRSLAELENYKKRSLKDRADLLKYQGDRIFTEILPILDNLELALQHSDSEGSSSNSGALKSGMQLIHKLFVDTLAKWEVRAESGLGKDFDPNRHSALSKVPTADKKPGTIINEFRKAYFYKDKLLRPGEVVVASEPVASDSANTGQASSSPSGE